VIERKLSLVFNDEELSEKRKFPRFPFTALSFKPQDFSHALKVKDISLSGMQCLLVDAPMDVTIGDRIQGKIHWKRNELKIQAKVSWKKESTLGIEFILNRDEEEELRKFLSFEQMAKNTISMFSAHQKNDYSHQLQNWLSADGVFELFVWGDSQLTISHFHILILETLIEWTEDKGFKTGKLKSKRNIETPLYIESECDYILDREFDIAKLHMAFGVIELLSPNQISTDLKSFILNRPL